MASAAYEECCTWQVKTSSCKGATKKRQNQLNLTIMLAHKGGYLHRLWFPFNVDIHLANLDPTCGAIAPGNNCRHGSLLIALPSVIAVHPSCFCLTCGWLPLPPAHSGSWLLIGWSGPYDISFLQDHNTCRRCLCHFICLVLTCFGGKHVFDQTEICVLADNIDLISNNMGQTIAKIWVIKFSSISSDQRPLMICEHHTCWAMASWIQIVDMSLNSIMVSYIASDCEFVQHVESM